MRSPAKSPKNRCCVTKCPALKSLKRTRFGYISAIRLNRARAAFLLDRHSSVLILMNLEQRFCCYLKQTHVKSTDKHFVHPKQNNLC